MGEVENVGRYGIRGHSCLLPSDGKDILKAQRLGCGLRDANCNIIAPLRNSSSMYTLMDECRIVPDVVLAWVICFFRDGNLLHHLLSQTWVSTWQGWQEFNDRKMADGGDLCEDIWVDDLLQQFLKISVEHVVINCLTDEKESRNC